MRRLLVFAAALSACSGLPPESAVPLQAGEFAVGLSVDLPVAGRRPGGVSAWLGVGAGHGVDLAVSADAPFTLLPRLQDVADGSPFVPPGLSVRKTFASGVGVGLGVGSAIGMAPKGGRHAFQQITAGPFVTVSTARPGEAPSGLVTRATGHAVYEWRTRRADSTAAVQHGPALYGVGTAGFVVADDTSRAVSGVRLVAGTGLGPTGGPGLALGAFVQGSDALGQRAP